MSSPRFAAATEIAEKVALHLHRHHESVRGRNSVYVSPVPATSDLEQVVDTAFWASLRHEEGYLPRISLAIASPRSCTEPMLFDSPIELTPAALAHLGPAVERPGIHLCVWRESGRLVMWGTSRGIPGFTAVVEVIGPGVLVFKHRHSGGTVKYVNIALLDGDEFKMIDESVAVPGNCPQLVAFLLGYRSRTSGKKFGNLLVQLAVSMRAHGRGGILLIVPPDSDWRSSMARPLLYALNPPYRALANVIGSEDEPILVHLLGDTLRFPVEQVGGLTAVDGATVVNSAYEVLAFGAKIVRREHSEQISHVLMTEPIEGRLPRLLSSAEVGGTRHMSAAQFVHDQRDAVALVASQDGRFTVFEWSTAQQMVHGHQVESLLL